MLGALAKDSDPVHRAVDCSMLELVWLDFAKHITSVMTAGYRNLGSPANNKDWIVSQQQIYG